VLQRDSRIRHTTSASSRRHRPYCCRGYQRMTPDTSSITLSGNMTLANANHVVAEIHAVFSAHLTMLESDIAEVGLSDVCPSVCHTCDTRRNGSRYRNTIRQSAVSIFNFHIAKFCSPAFRIYPKRAC